MASDDERVTTEGVIRGNTLSVRRFHLHVVAGPDAGARFTSSGQRVVIGTHESADLALTDTTVSRFHCEISVGKHAITVRDLGSTNGTRIHGISVEVAHLDGATRLELGRTQVELQLGDTFALVPLAARDSFGELVGCSPAMRAVFAQLERAAASDATVLLLGETGTGKELAARAIHEQGPRATGPFVVVDCGSLPHALIEGELFGYERGAFTGADRARPGSFEQASGGTIFLDELGELPLDLQPKLLRVLERREVQRLGAVQPQQVDVRIVAATNRDLHADVNAGRFRADLFFRLAVLEIVLPPLRERPDDLPLLVDAFLRTSGLDDKPEAAALRDETMITQLARHDWPGNVRELRNYLERCLVAPAEVAPGSGWEAPPPIDTARKLAAVRDAHGRYVERRYIVELLERCGGNVSAAARAAGVDRAHFYRIMTSCGMR